jgi:putative sterol carrier protein
MLNKPKDLIGTVLDVLFIRQFQDEAFLSDVTNWQMTVVLDTDYYPITLTFADGITIEKGAVPSPTITLVTTLENISRIANGEISPVRGILTRKIRIKGLFTHPRAALRFYRLMMKALGG